jgi:hypothetical protein
MNRVARAARPPIERTEESLMDTIAELKEQAKRA